MTARAEVWTAQADHFLTTILALPTGGQVPTTMIVRIPWHVLPK